MSSQLSPTPKNPKESARVLLKKHGLRPKKSLGQNFLINENVLKDIISAAELQTNDFVLEIGAGLGVLTRALAEKVEQVVALEKDPDLTKLLQKEFGDSSSVTILGEDVRSFLEKWEPPKDKEYKVVANLPFYLTSPLLRRLIDLFPPPSFIVVMVQKEVAERICARPPKSNRLATICRFRGLPEIVRPVPSSDFWPEPEVDAAILKISQIEQKPLDPVLMRLINAGFSSPRKTLANNLKSLGVSREFLTQCGFLPKVRAGALEQEDWLKLQNCFLGNKNAIIEPE